MPLYEYKCPNGHEFEKFFRSIGSAASEAECPTCGKMGQRVLSPAGLVFKGSGFYITDYGKDGKKAEREASSKPKADSPSATAGEATAKTDTKSDTKTAASTTSSEKPAPKESVPSSSPKKTTSE